MSCFQGFYPNTLVPRSFSTIIFLKSSIVTCLTIPLPICDSCNLNHDLAFIPLAGIKDLAISPKN